MHRMKILFGCILLMVYSMILIHDFIPHHTHAGEQYVFIHHHSHTQDANGEHSDCEFPHECDFPFHQHNINEAALFFTPSLTVVNVPVLSEIVLQELILEDEQCSENPSFYSYYQYLDYCEPDISATSLRGPPLS